MKIILFGTIYGSSKLYAEELSKRTGIETRSYDEVSSIDDYDTIVYIETYNKQVSFIDYENLTPIVELV